MILEGAHLIIDVSNLGISERDRLQRCILMTLDFMQLGIPMSKALHEISDLLSRMEDNN